MKRILGAASDGNPETSEPPERGSEDFVKWIPIVVPLFALALIVMVCIIAVAVL